MNEFYVYAHYKEDPIVNPLAVPYYIGKGMTSRLTKTFGRSSHHKNIIKKYGLWTKKLDDNLTEEQAFEAECFYISEIGRKDLKKGPLINLTDGGTGGKTSLISPNKGKKLSVEVRNHISITLKKIYSDKSKHPKLGKSWTLEQHEKMKNKIVHSGKSHYRFGKKLSEEVRKKIGDTQRGKKGRPHTEESKLKMSIAQKGIPKKGHPHTEEAKLKMQKQIIELTTNTSFTGARACAEHYGVNDHVIRKWARENRPCVSQWNQSPIAGLHFKYL